MENYQDKIKRFEFKRDEKNGMLIGPDGCHYVDEAQAMYFAQLGLCACGSPNDLHTFFCRCLGAHRDDHDTLIDIKKVQKEVEESSELVAEFILHFLDSRSLTEHGGSVYGSWLSERGKQFLEIGPAVRHPEDDNDCYEDDFGNWSEG